MHGTNSGCDRSLQATKKAGDAPTNVKPQASIKTLFAKYEANRGRKRDREEGADGTATAVKETPESDKQADLAVKPATASGKARGKLQPCNTKAVPPISPETKEAINLDPQEGSESSSRERKRHKAVAKVSAQENSGSSTKAGKSRQTRGTPLADRSPNVSKPVLRSHRARSRSQTKASDDGPRESGEGLKDTVNDDKAGSPSETVVLVVTTGSQMSSASDPDGVQCTQPQQQSPAGGPGGAGTNHELSDLKSSAAGSHRAAMILDTPPACTQASGCGRNSSQAKPTAPNASVSLEHTDSSPSEHQEAFECIPEHLTIRNEAHVKTEEPAVPSSHEPTGNVSLSHSRNGDSNQCLAAPSTTDTAPLPGEPTSGNQQASVLCTSSYPGSPAGADPALLLDGLMGVSEQQRGRAGSPMRNGDPLGGVGKQRQGGADSPTHGATGSLAFHDSLTGNDAVLEQQRQEQQHHQQQWQQQQGENDHQVAEPDWSQGIDNAIESILQQVDGLRCVGVSYREGDSKSDSAGVRGDRGGGGDGEGREPRAGAGMMQALRSRSPWADSSDAERIGRRHGSDGGAVVGSKDEGAEEEGEREAGEGLAGGAAGGRERSQGGCTPATAEHTKVLQVRDGVGNACVML